MFALSLHTTDQANQLTWTFRPRRTAMDFELRREGSSWRSLIESMKFCNVSNPIELLSLSILSVLAVVELTMTMKMKMKIKTRRHEEE